MRNPLDERYFSDFTRKNYAKLLKIALKNHNFIDYTSVNDHKKYILWRHDVDYSINRAVELAKIENKLGVISTFFLHLQSPGYNIFDRKTYRQIKQILSLGHKLGLHFDANFYEIRNKDELISKLCVGSDIIYDLFDEKIKVFSFHEPSKFVLSEFTDYEYSGLINTYSNFFKNEVAYCSDSNGIWRFKRLEDFLIDNSEDKLQVLTHPVWWSREVLSPRDRIKKCFEDIKLENLKIYYDERKKRKRPVVK
tara:strand:+ start:1110 stop:1862 length:753 start_codon:yes stop_codon:yes gene_type:complete